MIHYQKQTKPFIIQVVILMSVVLLFLALLLNMIFTNRYPQITDLQYENCTFISYEYKSVGRATYQYYIYVEEYQEPFKIDNIVQSKVNDSLLQSIRCGDTVTISIEDMDNLCLYEMSIDEKLVLSYDDYLLMHENNMRVGIQFSAIVVAISFVFLVVAIIYYKKTGNCLPGFR